MNYRVFRAINNLSGNQVLDAVMRWWASYLIFGLFAISAALVWRQLRLRRWFNAAQVGGCLLITFLLGLAAAALHLELRPFQTHRVHQLVAHSGGQSFPSDHATAAFGVALAVLVFLSWRWGLALFAGAVSVGFARVYDGIHYPGDILGGLLVALLAVGVVVAGSRLRHARTS